MKHSVTDAGDLRKYFAIIPKIVFRLGLNPYELTLYAHLKQIAGEDGTCWKSTSSLAQDTGMGAGTVSRTKAMLAQPRPQLNGKALITISETMSNGGNPNHAISITDIWPENIAELERVRVAKATRSTHEATRSTQERARSSGEDTRSTHDYKEEPIKKNPKEELNEELFPPFHGDEFLTTLADFEEHRKEIRKPLRKMGRKQLYAKLGCLGEDRAVAALKYSMGQGWIGVFEEATNGNRQQYKSASERNNDRVRANLALVAQLRGEGGGNHN